MLKEKFSHSVVLFGLYAVDKKDKKINTQEIEIVQKNRNLVNTAYQLPWKIKTISNQEYSIYGKTNINGYQNAGIPFNLTFSLKKGCYQPKILINSNNELVFHFGNTEENWFKVKLFFNQFY